MKRLRAFIPLPEEEDLVLIEVLEGLHQPQKKLPCKLFYNEAGSELFEKICQLDDYYVTQTEMSILEQNIIEIAGAVGENLLLIELGSGSNRKAKLLLNYLNVDTYAPVGISREYLLSQTNEISEAHPEIKILPMCADYTQPFVVPHFLRPSWKRKLVFYPGSSFGNFDENERLEILDILADLAEKDGRILMGIDLKKDKSMLEKAYNDPDGVTAEFNLNILRHLNERWRSGFELEHWQHHAFYNEAFGRIEMHLVSLKKQWVPVEDQVVFFGEGETILTEYSYKYTIEELEKLVSDIFRVEQFWTDEKSLFALFLLSVR